MSVILTTPEELARIVREQIDAALAARGPAANDAIEWLDAADVAKLLGCAPRSVQKMVRTRGLPAHRLGEKLLRYRRDDVERWMRESRG